MRVYACPSERKGMKQICDYGVRSMLRSTFSKLKQSRINDFINLFLESNFKEKNYDIIW
jgi:hypothetical protein